MNIKLKCVDFTGTPHAEFLRSRKIFIARGIVKLGGGDCFVFDKMPGTEGFLMSRFILLEDAVIKLPEDIKNIDL